MVAGWARGKPDFSFTVGFGPPTATRVVSAGVLAAGHDMAIVGEIRASPGFPMVGGSAVG